MDREPERDWSSTWPDAVAFVSVLALVWWTRAQAADLVWSLWLSSLVVGASIVAWATLRPLIELALSPRQYVRSADGTSLRPAFSAPDVTFRLIGAMFTLGFFAAMWSFAHYMHASIVDGVFHIGPPHDWKRSYRAQEIETFRLIVRSYWGFLPAAFLAERATFFRAPGLSSILPATTTRQEIARGGTYTEQRDKVARVAFTKVLRMHLLIFFFIVAHVVHLDNFVIYVVVYAVYFFPWRVVKRPPAQRTFPTGPVERRDTLPAEGALS